MSRLRLRLAPIVVLILAVAPGLAGCGRQKPAAIRSTGTLEADEVLISPKIGARLSRVYVNEGDAVEPGRLLFVLDMADMEAQRSQMRAACRQAEARLHLLQAGPRAEEVERAEADVQAARAAYAQAEREHSRMRAAYAASAPRAEREQALAPVRGAEAQLRLRLAGPRAQEVERARAQVAEAQQNLSQLQRGARSEDIAEAEGGVRVAAAVLEQAKRDHERTRGLFEKEAVSRQQLDVAEAALEAARGRQQVAAEQLNRVRAGAREEEIQAARERLRQARASLQMLQAGSRREEIEGARAALAEARAGLDRRIDAAESALESASGRLRAARAELRLVRQGARREEIEAARAALAQARAGLEQIDAQLREAKIYAPTAGFVSDVPAKIGEVVRPGQVMATLSGRDVWVEVFVEETQAGRLRLNQPARITSLASPATFAGRVARISETRIGERQNKETRDVRTLRVRIEIRKPDPTLKAGMSADVEIPLS